MSFTRLDYDCCAYSKDLKESTSPLEYWLYKGKYENCKNCPDNTNNIEFGAKADVENELWNLTRSATKCPSKKYDPASKFKHVNTTNPVACDRIPSGLAPTGIGYNPDNFGLNHCPVKEGFSSEKYDFEPCPSDCPKNKKCSGN